ncbi:MAG: radical SAM/SPASM domain-containing protein [Flexilinea sp.]
MRHISLPLFSGKPDGFFMKGLFEKQVIDENGNTSRIHLRIDDDGTGILWVNANQTFYLNPSAGLMTWCLISGKKDSEIEQFLKKRYPKDFARVIADFRVFAPQIRDLFEGKSGVCELCQSGISSTMPFSTIPSAPYRMDLALTYTCNNLCTHCYNDKNRIGETLSVETWKKILQKIAKSGIPHVVFTGGEPTVFPGLLELITEAENLGLVSGMNTNGRRLKDAGFVSELASRKLDHVQVTLESDIEEIHDAMVGCPGAWKETVAGIQNAIQSGLYLMTNTTLLKSNASEERITSLLRFLAEIGVKTVGLNALIYSGSGKEVNTGLDESELPALLEIATKICEENDQQLIWYTPTQYCYFDPLEFNLGIKGCSAARYSMCIEPDGTVIPCQSWYQRVGNILKDPWEKIWNAPLCTDIRSRKIIPAACFDCERLQECGGGCPLAQKYKPPVRPQQAIPSCF